MAFPDNPSAAASRRPSMLSVLFIATLAFLLASFPVRHSDLWRHLAAGRQLVRDMPTSVIDADQSWLFDVVCYAVYTTLDGAGLVIVKALLVAALAVLLLRLSHQGAGWWLPVFCTVLAMLAMSMRLLVAPITISVLLLALAIWIVRNRDESSPRWLPPWPLLILFVVWVNVDRWFLIGLGTVALMGLGRAVDLMRAAPPADGHAPGRRVMAQTAVWVFVLGAACLVNPSHARAFESGALMFAPGTSPFQQTYLSAVGVSPAGLAYFPLLALGLLSFFLTMQHWSWQRFLPWLALAVLSAANARTIPFFAVVAGPVLTWNLQDFFSRRPTSNSFILRAGAAALGLAFLAAAWPGWLQAPPFAPRRWAIDTPASFERGAATIRQWLKDEKLEAGTNSMHISPDTADAFAWFCPEDQGRHDRNLVSDILGDAEAAGHAADRLRAANINRLIVYDAERARLAAILSRLLADPSQWPLLHVEGSVAVFGWRDPGNPQAMDALRKEAPDFEALAFHASAARPTPRRGPEQEAERWWDPFWRPRPASSFDLETAQLHLAHAEALRRLAPYRHLAAWDQAHAVALLAPGASRMGIGSLVQLHLQLTLLQPALPEPGFGFDRLPDLERLGHALQQQFTLQRDDAPSALLYLGVRSARRALIVNPRSAQAHLVLGDTYLRLLKATRERAWTGDLPRLVQLRRAQVSAALHQALDLKPDLADAHLSLAGLYRDMGYTDLELIHRRAYLELTRKAGVPAEAQFRAAVASMDEEVADLTRQVADQSKSFATQSQGLRVYDRAVLALQKGLGAKARDILLASDFAAFGAQGMALEFELLLKTGRAKDVRAWTNPQQREVLGEPTYNWVRAQAFAALGDYERARDECAKLAAALRGPEPERTRERIALLAGGTILSEQPLGRTAAQLLARCWDRHEAHERLLGLGRGLQQEAEANVLQGLIAIEEGALDEADVAFRLALSIWKDQGTAAAGGGLDFLGRAAAQDCLARLK